tara:strand:- start:141 stop:317 length:177 start_codon:yes stop_codon:yes gene_type:complete
MNKIWNAIADFFELIFIGVEFAGDIMNYLYILIIFVFLVVWTVIMQKHKKENSEHAPL